MAGKSEGRRYLVDVDTVATPQLFTDCLIIGAGVAGLRSAIEAAKGCSVILVCKGRLDESNTWEAQGGIAAALEESDSFDSHIADTLKAGCGINDEAVVKLVVSQGPELINELLQWGAEFDMSERKIATTYEGGHSNPRVVHAHGDETGRVITDVLIQKVSQSGMVKVLEDFYAIDLLTNVDGECVGVIGNGRRGRQIIWSRMTILASGGAGQLYRETTNPRIATADGIAMAYRAGARLQDLEFMQFHPTTLYVAGASRALVSETLRGEGAKLIDKNGYQFMTDYDKAAELAPRDVVSRAILSQMLKTGSTHVYLDVRHFPKKRFAKRFPKINELCESFDIDVSSDLIPVRPSAHYMIGGVKVDTCGRTSIKNLLACGEAAATALHGANRLGSNSLLEGLVFGKAVGRQVCENTGEKVAVSRRPHVEYQVPYSDRTALDITDVRNSLRALMWRNVGINRRRKALSEAREIIRFWQRYVMDKLFDYVEGWECQNMLTVCYLMASSAQQRKESRGVHYRSDYPEQDDQQFRRHIVLAV